MNHKLIPIIIICLILTFTAQASANSIRFSGLSQVNKTIDVYDINDIAAGGDGYVSTINNSELFYFTPGDSYNFEIRAKNNTTFLNNASTFGNFIFNVRSAVVLYFIFLLFFAAMFFGGAFLIFRRK